MQINIKLYPIKRRVQIQKMIKKPCNLADICFNMPMYTLFCIKIKKFFLFFLKVVTIGTNSRSVVYQHLFAQICIFSQDTIGYKRYNCLKNIGIPTI